MAGGVDEKDVRSFLVQHPRGAKVLVRTVDDDQHEVASPSGKGGSWATVARSIMALNPVVLEAYDAEGRLLRATRLDSLAGAAVAAGAPQPLPVLHSDPETARLTHFANLLYRATEFSTNLAFTKMVELFQLSTERTAAIEARLERTEANYRKTMQERLDEAFERAEEMAHEAALTQKEAEANQADPLGEMVKQFAQGAMGGGPPAVAPNGTTKGKA